MPDDFQDPRCRLYLVTPPAFEVDAFVPELAAALSGGDVACVQLRMKEAPDKQILHAGQRLLEVCDAHDAALVINDRADLAAELGAEGVHLGQGDGSVADARELLGPDGVIGVTCHDSRDLAFEAGEAGADYVAFGAFFDSPTKPSKYRPAPDMLTWWSEIARIPSVAIGGITIENCGILAKAGADFVAVCSAVWDHGAGPKEAVRLFNEALDNAAD